MPKRPNGYKTFLTWTATAFGVLLVLGGLGFFAVAGYARLYEGRVFPGVRALGVRLDGLTADEARAALNQAVDQARKDGLRFRYVTDAAAGKAREVTLETTMTAPNDPDFARDLLRFNLDEPIVAAMSYGRGNNLLVDTFMRWRARVTPVNLDVKTDIDETAIREAVLSTLKDSLLQTKDASLQVTWDAANRRPETKVLPEQAGRAIRWKAAFATLRRQAERLRFEPIALEDQIEQPVIAAADAETAAQDVPAMLARAPFRLSYDDETSGKTSIITVTTSTLAGWINVGRTDGKTELTLDPERLNEGLRKLAPDIEKTAKKGELVIENDKVKNFRAGTEGVTIDDAATRRAILDAWAVNSATTTLALQVTREAPALSGADPERLGIKEIIGVGRTNFSGSPANRRKNIATGAKKISGSLIAPGEEFSLLKALVPFTEKAGWLPELVIKGNKTVPELGGGLCQIGTTLFRAILASGLPITERQSHSYRVRYYEPAGADATIYEPKPDFRFVNDTGSYILINGYVNGNEVTFEVWGTKDGRTTLFTGRNETSSIFKLMPKIFNITPPPPKKIIETLDLAPGKTKCTETAHAGADAEFTYAVTYADGTVKKEIYRSHYRPWQAICLVGVEKLTEPAPAEGAAPSEGSPDASVVQ